jgi:hypothetical protein
MSAPVAPELDETPPAVGSSDAHRRSSLAFHGLRQVLRASPFAPVVIDPHRCLARWLLGEARYHRVRQGSTLESVLDLLCFLGTIFGHVFFWALMGIIPQFDGWINLCFIHAVSNMYFAAWGVMLSQARPESTPMHSIITITALMGLPESMEPLTICPFSPTRLAAAAQVDLAVRVTFTLEAAVQVGATAWFYTAVAALCDFDVRQVPRTPAPPVWRGPSHSVGACAHAES